jgi:hypothetical protein
MFGSAGVAVGVARDDDCRGRCREVSPVVICPEGLGVSTGRLRPAWRRGGPLEDHAGRVRCRGHRDGGCGQGADRHTEAHQQRTLLANTLRQMITSKWRSLWRIFARIVVSFALSAELLQDNRSENGCGTDIFSA